MPELRPETLFGLNRPATREQLIDRLNVDERLCHVHDQVEDGLLVLVVEDRRTGHRYNLLYLPSKGAMERWLLEAVVPWRA